jgi:hypothetical protein
VRIPDRSDIVGPVDRFELRIVDNRPDGQKAKLGRNKSLCLPLVRGQVGGVRVIFVQMYSIGSIRKDRSVH